MKARNLIVYAVSWMLIAACDRAPTVASGSAEGVRAAVTTELASHLTSEGRFNLLPPSGGERALVAENVAREVALTMARRLGPMIKTDLESQHQGPIAFDRLALCGQAYFAFTPFESIPETLPPEMVFFLGSRWILGICQGGETVISVSVAANATETTRTRLGLFGPNGSVMMVGVPPGWDGAIPVSAENAAILASTKTGRRLSSVPVLYAPNPLDAFPQGSTWVFDVDSDVVLRGLRSGAQGAQRRFAIGTESVESNPMLRGAVDLFVSKPGNRRVLPFWTANGGGRVGADLRVRDGAWIDIERGEVGKDGVSP